MLLSRKFLALGLFAGLAACGPHAAQFSKPDVTMDQRALDYADCQQQAGTIAGATAVTGGVTDSAVRTVQVDALTNCMLGKGYTR